MNKPVTGHRRGLWAESLAGVVLCLKGYRIRARRYKTPVGEIDLIAEKGGVTAFVEIKYRQTLEAALDAVTPQGQARIRRAAEWYLAAAAANNAGGRTLRFDVMAITPPCLVHHRRNVF